jgi:hypothetical protein
MLSATAALKLVPAVLRRLLVGTVRVSPRGTGGITAKPPLPLERPAAALPLPTALAALATPALATPA